MAVASSVLLHKGTSSSFVVLRAICAGHSSVSRVAESLRGVREYVVLRAICMDPSQLFVRTVSLVCVSVR